MMKQEPIEKIILENEEYYKKQKNEVNQGNEKVKANENKNKKGNQQKKLVLALLFANKGRNHIDPNGDPAKKIQQKKDLDKTLTDL